MKEQTDETEREKKKVQAQQERKQIQRSFRTKTVNHVKHN